MTSLSPELHGATDREVRLFRALVEMTRANNGRGAREGYPDAFTPSSLHRRSGIDFRSSTKDRDAWHNLCVTRGLIDDAQHPTVRLYRLTPKGREVADRAFPVKAEPACAMGYTAEACLRADPEGSR